MVSIFSCSNNLVKKTEDSVFIFSPKSTGKHVLNHGNQISKLSITLETNKTTFDLGDTVSATLTIRNLSFTDTLFIDRPVRRHISAQRNKEDTYVPYFFPVANAESSVAFSDKKGRRIYYPLKGKIKLQPREVFEYSIHPLILGESRFSELFTKAGLIVPLMPPGPYELTYTMKHVEFSKEGIPNQLIQPVAYNFRIEMPTGTDSILFAKYDSLHAAHWQTFGDSISLAQLKSSINKTIHQYPNSKLSNLFSNLLNLISAIK